MMITLRALTLYAALPLLVLLSACRGDDVPKPPATTSETRPSFEQDIPVAQLLPPPTDNWRNQPTVRTPIRVGPDSLPVLVNWTPTQRGAHRAISRVVVNFPEHPASDSLSATIFGGSLNHGTRNAVLQGMTLHVLHHRDGGSIPTVVHLRGDGTAQLY